MKKKIETWLLGFIDAIFAVLPYKSPSLKDFFRCRLIAHRGQYDNVRVMENTLEAFSLAVRAGVWGIELDVRFTRDGVPVVFHDEDLLRLFGIDALISDFFFSQLQTRFPSIPSLKEVVDDFRGQIHFMVEIKAMSSELREKHAETLYSTLEGLLPVEDFHLLALDIDIFSFLKIFPPACLIAVGRWNFSAFSREAIHKPWAGVAGHYLFVRDRHIRRHHEIGQGIGTGQINSLRCLYREIGRGVDWIFIDRPLELIRSLEKRHIVFEKNNLVFSRSQRSMESIGRRILPTCQPFHKDIPGDRVSKDILG